MSDVPAETEVIGWFDSLSNWGRWGDADELGTLNLITPAVRREAAQLVREGIRVSCGWNLEPATAGPVQRFMDTSGEGLADEHRVQATSHGSTRTASAGEYLGIRYHGGVVTHVDALSHMFWDRRMYNGKPAELVTVSLGATTLDITAARDGVFTRGVLMDIPPVRGVDWLDGGDGVFPEDLEAAEERTGIRVREGDAVLLRTGYARRRRELGPATLSEGLPGWHAATLPWLHERGVAVAAADTAMDVIPSGYSEITLPLHVVGIVAMGLWTIDNCELERLAATCAELERWEFLFSFEPLRIVGGTGSPINPVATF
jgi:kynurenine formamidase